MVSGLGFRRPPPGPWPLVTATPGLHEPSHQAAPLCWRISCAGQVHGRHKGWATEHFPSRGTSTAEEARLGYGPGKQRCHSQAEPTQSGRALRYQ